MKKSKKFLAENTVAFHGNLIESLRNPDEAIAYLRGALGEYEQDGDWKFLLQALRNITEAHRTVRKLS